MPKRWTPKKLGTPPSFSISAVIAAIFRFISSLRLSMSRTTISNSFPCRSPRETALFDLPISFNDTSAIFSRSSSVSAMPSPQMLIFCVVTATLSLVPANPIRFLLTRSRREISFITPCVSQFSFVSSAIRYFPSSCSALFVISRT